MKDNIFTPILAIGYLNFLLLLFALIIFYSFFSAPASYEIRMPISANRGIEANQSVAIRISAENVLFIDDKVVTFNDLKRAMQKKSNAVGTIYVQVDNRATMARLTDVLEMCKGLGVADVKVSTF